VLTRTLCRFGVHKWRHLRNPEGEAYKTCRRCRKDGGYEGNGAILKGISFGG
jgi:hypothetical protein